MVRIEIEWKYQVQRAKVSIVDRYENKFTRRKLANLIEKTRLTIIEGKHTQIKRVSVELYVMTSLQEKLDKLVKDGYVRVQRHLVPAVFIPIHRK